MPVLFVALGGAFGSVARYVAGVIVARYTQHILPYATFVVNLLGALIIGMLAGWLLRYPDSETHNNLRLLLATGFCGGFTTFSSFSLETFNLIRAGHMAVAAGYIAGSVVLCLALTALGFMLTSGGR